MNDPVSYSSDDKVVNGLKNGEDQAFSILYEEFSTSTFNHLYKVLRNKEVAEEILHDTFILALKKINFFKGGSLKNWIYRLAFNLAIDYLRKEKLRKRHLNDLLPPKLDSCLEDQVISKEDKKCINDNFERLNPLQRMFLNLRIGEEMTYMEISRICGCSIGSVKQGIFRAKKALGLLFKERPIR